MDDQLNLIEDNIQAFFSKNQVKFDTYETFQEQLQNLSEESYPDLLNFVKDNRELFFKDHSSCIFFFFFVFQYSQLFFQRLEIILDIIVYFGTELKSHEVTESELLSISMFFPNGTNYLFQKKIISIQTIIEQTVFSKFLFIYFLPEIEEYDSEYAELRENDLFSNVEDQLIEKELAFYKSIKSDPKKHIDNRNTNYHPSLLHKAIREDDIDTFQFLLSKNNYGVNYEIEYSNYERAVVIDENLSLIQVACLYGSVKIFKFLWMQKDIILNHNLLSYAYYGCNFEIIHLCETKCSHDDVCIQPIVLYRHDLLEYYLENFADEIKEKDEEVNKKICLFVEKENNIYNKLPYDSLLSALFSFNIQVIKTCLLKIIYIAQNVEFNNDWNYSREDSILKYCAYEIDLFQFIYSQRKVEVDKYKCPCYFNSLIYCLEDEANDTFKFLFNDLYDGINFKFIFINAIEINHEIANFLLDLQLKEKDENKENSLFSHLYKIISFDNLMQAIKYYKENIIVKMIKLYDYMINENNASDFISKLKITISSAMIYSLFEKLIEFIQNNLLVAFSLSLNSPKYSKTYNLITNNIASKYIK